MLRGGLRRRGKPVGLRESQVYSLVLSRERWKWSTITTGDYYYYYRRP